MNERFCVGCNRPLAYEMVGAVSQPSNCDCGALYPFAACSGRGHIHPDGSHQLAMNLLYFRASNLPHIHIGEFLGYFLFNDELEQNVIDMLKAKGLTWGVACADASCVHRHVTSAEQALAKAQAEKQSGVVEQVEGFIERGEW